MTHKSKARVKVTGEVFTKPELVLEIMNSMAFDWSENVVDNSCGNGNFLHQVLTEKFKILSPQQAIKSTFGVDLMWDNVQEARERLLDVAVANTPEIDQVLREKYKRWIRKQVVCHDAITYQYMFDGSHDCVRQGVCEDCKRNQKPSYEDIERFLRK